MPQIVKTSGMDSTKSNTSKTPEPTSIHFYDRSKIGSQLVKNRRDISFERQNFDSKVDLEAV